MSEVLWPGKSGRLYRYIVYPIDQAWKSVPGNYIFAKLVGDRWSPVYIGESENLKNRHAAHEKAASAKRHGATHIHAHGSSENHRERLAEETDLRRNFPSTPCNLQ
jgi:hypothetical protein